MAAAVELQSREAPAKESFAALLDEWERIGGKKAGWPKHIRVAFAGAVNQTSIESG